MSNQEEQAVLSHARKKRIRPGYQGYLTKLPVRIIKFESEILECLVDENEKT